MSTHGRLITLLLSDGQRIETLNIHPAMCLMALRLKLAEKDSKKKSIYCPLAPPLHAYGLYFSMFSSIDQSSTLLYYLHGVHACALRPL